MKIVGKEAIKGFMMAGKATLTVENEKTGNRFTFNVRAPREADESRMFVKVLTGACNESDYSYLGTIFKSDGGPRYFHGKKSAIGPEAPSARAFAWLFDRLFGDKSLPEEVAVYHDGRCGRCGRKLTTPESVLSGFGPECREKMMTAAL